VGSILREIGTLRGSSLPVRAQTRVGPCVRRGSSVAAHGMGARAPNPSPAGSWELPKFEEEKLEVGWGVTVHDHLGQTNYAEICILVTKIMHDLAAYLQYAKSFAPPPSSPSGSLPLDPAGGLPFPRPPGPLSPDPGYATKMGRTLAPAGEYDGSICAAAAAMRPYALRYRTHRCTEHGTTRYA